MKREVSVEDRGGVAVNEYFRGTKRRKGRGAKASTLVDPYKLLGFVRENIASKLVLRR